ncbi:MAG: hypothetical protein RLZZ453_715 [Chlamydiota bacterium]|jgi:hypothetical protein
MMYRLFLCVFFTCYVCAEEPASQISSKEAGYDGSTLVLDGDVFIQHEVAKMQAQKARIEKQEQDPLQPFSLIDLENQVHLFLQPASHITCHLAHFDFTKLKGVLLGRADEQIVYKDVVYPKKQGASLPICLHSDKLDIDIIKKGTDKVQYEVEHLRALDNVMLSYGEDLKLFSHAAAYAKTGVCTASAKDVDHPCTLVYRQQQMTASEIEANFDQERLHLKKPSGSLPACFSPQSALFFKALAMDWDQTNDKLRLKGAVEVKDPALGVLLNQEEIQLTLSSEDKKKLESLQTKGPSDVTYYDVEGGRHALFVPGPLVLDGKERTVITEPVDQPIQYRNDLFFVLADKAVIQYQENTAGEMEPLFLRLTGHVRLISSDPTKPQKMSLADTLVYSFQTGVCQLQADKGKKVLFKDEAEGMRLSAPELQITYSGQEKEPHIKGIGAVQFSFTPDEESEIKHIFSNLDRMP